jgi:multimeric flavodoxin WrbA
MSKILVLQGSLRKNGNTDLLVQAFIDGAKDNNEIEVISVGEYNIAPCTGCNCCLKNGNICVQNDDMQYVYKQLAVSDVVVITSPVYFYGVSARLKAIIDRLHNPLRNTFGVKKLALLLVGGASIPNLFDAVNLQYKMILDFFKLEDAGSVCVSNVREIGDIKNHAALKDAFNLGASIK